MKNRTKLLTHTALTVVLISTCTLALANPLDSIRYSPLVTKSITSEEHQAKKSNPSTQNTNYKVKEGDTLFSIATRKFSSSVNQLKEANNLKDDRINVGEVLNIPYDNSSFLTPDTIKLTESIVAQELPRRRDAEKRLEEEVPAKVEPKQPSKEQPATERYEQLPRRREADEVPERIPPLEEYEEIIPDFFNPITNRWLVPSYARNIINPYNQNVLKGDYPIIGNDIFFIFTGISDTLFEFRELPVPAGISTERPGSADFFGRDNQYFIRQNLFLRFELLEGDTAFKPPDWSIVATAALNIPEYLSVQERGIVSADVTDGTSRTTYDFAMQELFFEYHLHNISDRFDFISTKTGIQPFNLDFRGFIFLDSNLGFRLFGNFDNNRWQYNLAFFDQLEKDTTSEFNTLSRRDQQLLIANIYREDFIWLGYTTQFSILYNRDDGGIKFDDNRFLVRPDPVGDARAHDIDVVYLGWTSNGHIGRLNVNHALYLAFGRDDRNPLAGRNLDIFGQMAALELSVDFDWLRPKISAFFSSGDSDPTDGDARGFDTVLDKPNFAGGGFSFWSRQGIRLLGVGLVQRESLIPNLRSSKIEGQANFVNPGLFLVNAGLDVEVTPKLKTFFNANYLRFVQTEPLEVFLNQPDIDNDIGFDLSIGLFYRPLNTNNIIVTGGVATLIPGEGFEDILTSSVLFQGFINLILIY